ncbi:Inosine-uridine nucleoside N-ribohydrolase [Verrucomicrobia bacterium]|nr:Inosine-uridine nucleoside N-ribohydrolase [Verrucomicrobiota bacterium]
MNGFTMIDPVSITRRQFLQRAAVASAAIAALPSAFAAAAPPAKRRPVILTTDIGDDIDDTWALGFLLKCPELDLKLVVGDYGKSKYRAKLLAKFLHTVSHDQIPVGIGLDIEPHGDGPQKAWIEDYDLSSYRGRVHENGVQAIIDTIMQSPESVTVIDIAPTPNIAAALAREPRIAERARFVGMYGSVRMGYDRSSKCSAEWNVKAAPQACQKIFAAPWDVTITPLDTCGLVNLNGERYRKIRESRDPIASAVIENYRIWNKGSGGKPGAAEEYSSTLFDTVAVYLAFSQDFCKMERLGIRVTDDGFTLIDPKAKPVNAALSWQSLDGFRDLLVDRLVASGA